MQLAILCVCRNEANRWLPSVLNAWASFADIIVALDDGSTDDTGWLLREQPKVDYYLREADEPMWGNEVETRAALWRLFVESGAEWGLVLDADMVPAWDPRPLLHESADAIAFNLYDLWSLDPLLYRRDGHWQAHANWRCWAFRNPGPDFQDEWPERGIHCGHAPMNLPLQRVVQAPNQYGLLHMAYSDAEERQRKHAQYMSKADQLQPHELDHANSILDNRPSLAAIPFSVQYEITKANAAEV